MGKTAAIAGATGLVGGMVLKKLLADDAYDKVIVLGRKTIGINHPKLEERIGDLLSSSYWQFQHTIDEAFCCVGTTRAKTKDITQYKQIDMGIPVHLCQWGLTNGMQKYMVVSAMGADENSRIFYNRIKGQMEEALRKMPVPQLHILRPSLILGKREEFRFGEKVGKVLASIFSVFIPAKYKGIEAKSIADAMLILANSSNDQVIFESDEIRDITA